MDSFNQDTNINPLWAKIEQLSSEVESKCITWRRDFHQNPELGNREFRTSKLIATHLKSLGLEVKTGIAHTGVVGILRGKKDSPVVALRADMDALPVTETVDLPFASKVKVRYKGVETGVMHACGHDVHMAVLMAVAEVLSNLKEELPGTVKFIFQPAEEGAPIGEEGGANLMIKEGVLESPKVDAIFALHVFSSPGTAWSDFLSSRRHDGQRGQIDHPYQRKPDPWGFALAGSRPGCSGFTNRHGTSNHYQSSDRPHGHTGGYNHREYSWRKSR